MCSGGVERRVQELSTRMAKMGHEVFVYARKNYSQKDINNFQGVKIIYLPCIATKNLEAITHTFLASLHAIFHRYDVVHYQAPGPSSLCWIVKLFNPGTALVATFNSRDELHQKWGRFAQAYLRFGEWVISRVPNKTIVVSEILRDYVRKKYHKNAVVIRNGSAVNIPEGSDEIKRWNLEKNKYFLSVSRLVKHKGIHYLIKAFRNAQKSNRIPSDFKLAIVDDSANTDDYVSCLKEMSGVDRNIVFVGKQTREPLAELFYNAFAFVLPSEAEGLSNSLLEAIGYGIPVIVSSIIENVAVVLENGLIFKNKDEKDLEEKLVFAINNVWEIKNLSRKAKLQIEKEYSWDKNVSKTLKLYEDLISEKSNKGLAFSYFRRLL